MYIYKDESCCASIIIKEAHYLLLSTVVHKKKCIKADINILLWWAWLKNDILLAFFFFSSSISQIMYLTLALLFCVLHMLRFLQPGCTVAGTNNVWMTGVLMMQFIISLKHSTHGATNNHFDSCVSLCLSACLVVSPTRAQQYLSFINNRFWHFPSISSLGLSEVQQIAVSRFRWFKGAVKGRKPFTYW